MLFWQPLGRYSDQNCKIDKREACSLVARMLHRELKSSYLKVTPNKLLLKKKVRGTQKTSPLFFLYYGGGVTSLPLSFVQFDSKAPRAERVSR